MMAGPLCAMLLGDLGADVVKVEPPEGDTIRSMGETFIGGETEYFLSLNRNKRGVVVNLKTEGGRGVVSRLVARADVVVENFRPGTAARLGLDYPALRDLNPGLVYCSISGYGPAGVNSSRPALDPVIQAMAGLMQLTGTAESGPLRTGFPLADLVTPLFATIGILAALEARRRTGHGQRVDLSMLDATIFSMIPREGYYFVTGQAPARLGNEHYQLAPVNTYETSDGRHLMVLAHSDKFWRSFAAALGEPELADDPRFKTNADRVRHREELNRLVAARFREGTLETWTRRLGEAGVVFAPVRSIPEVFADPDVQRNMVVELEHPAAGRIKVLANPIRLAETPAEVSTPSPRLGEHTGELLRELGYSADDIARLSADGAVGLAGGASV
ncbi:MAG: CoA transferase [Candidatus Rokubacteria bacterium]|nr:CoA transferase [Candidatus Rokubacteria bacterium]